MPGELEGLADGRQMGLGRFKVLEFNVEDYKGNAEVEVT
jgi:hypothetical protein